MYMAYVVLSTYRICSAKYLCPLSPFAAAAGITTAERAGITTAERAVVTEANGLCKLVYQLACRIVSTIL